MKFIGFKDSLKSLFENLPGKQTFKINLSFGEELNNLIRKLKSHFSEFYKNS